jgi:hypothetical protein
MTKHVAHRPSVSVLVVAVALVAVAGGGAYAATDGGGKLHGCAAKSNGALRLAMKCKKSERNVSWNIEGPQGKQGLQGPSGAPGAPATKLWAVVNETSTIVRSSGGVTISRVAAGLYRLTFPQNVANCAAVVSIGATTVGNNLQSGEASASASGAGLGTNVVSVATFNDSGTFTDKPFDVAVFC